MKNFMVGAFFITIIFSMIGLIANGWDLFLSFKPILGDYKSQSTKDLFYRNGIGVAIEVTQLFALIFICEFIRKEDSKFLIFTGISLIVKMGIYFSCLNLPPRIFAGHLDEMGDVLATGIMSGLLALAFISVAIVLKRRALSE